jgi:hypothetical protein
MSAKSKTASASRKDELQFELIKSTRNSDRLLPFVCHIDAQILDVKSLWSNNTNMTYKETEANGSLETRKVIDLWMFSSTEVHNIERHTSLRVDQSLTVP